MKIRQHMRSSASALLGLISLGLASEAHAQSGAEAVAVDDIQGAEAFDILANGSLQITMSNGFTVILPPDQFYVSKGQTYVTPAAMALNGLVPGASAPLSLGTIALGTVAVGGGAAAAIIALDNDKSSDGGDESGGDDNASDGDDTDSGDGGSNSSNRAPVISSETTHSVFENQFEAYQVEASDLDNDTLTYSISGTDSDLFDIDSESGAITFKTSPDYEAPLDSNEDGIYIINVTADDGTETVSQTVAIVVKNANDAPNFTSDAAVSIEENQTLAYQTIVDDFEGDDITFSLSGDDAALFTINSETGEVRFTEAPDFEDPQDDSGANDYNITVTADDGTSMSSQDVTIIVTDVNEAAAITTATSLDVPENQTSVVTIDAEDPEGDVLSYSLTGGADQALFAIDSSTGELTFLTAPDYESPASNAGTNSYEVQVTVNDGIQDSVLDLTVNVTDETEAVGLPPEADSLASVSAFTLLNDMPSVDLDVFDNPVDIVPLMPVEADGMGVDESGVAFADTVASVTADVLDLTMQQMAESDHSDMITT
ncbi:cadherin domain-containing protein [Altericroceibacterium spongiae]|nr:cadherin domain-containing protein [Altericroceibacterium spongiae]